MKSARFITEFKALDVAEGNETRKLQLYEPFVVFSGILNDTVTVPEGFTFDGESIPTALHTLVPPFGQSKRGACVHDYLYRYHGYQSASGEFVPVTRKTADAVYRELVTLKGLPTWRAAVRHGVLRLVGWIAWNNQPK